MKKGYLVGIDIGGTKIAVVLADARGRILRSSDFLIRHDKKPAYSIQLLIQVIHELKKESPLAGIGVGSPGPVNPQSGKIPWSPNLAGWEGLPIGRILTREFRVPVFIENDANAAVVCEKQFGQGRGKNDLIYITVSTGIGGGLILSGQLYSGHNFCGGELGHMTIVPGGDLCKCGKRGCLEAYASGTAIAKMGHMSSKILKEKAEKGNRKAVHIFAEAGRYLGIGIGNLINLLNPEIIILGGGVMKGNGKAVRTLWKSMIQSAKKESWPLPFKGCKIVRSRIVNYVGALGAASLVLEKLKR